MNKVGLLLGLVVACMGLAACMPAAALPPLPTNTPLPPTGTPTPTIVWFPPTATNTPLPTSTLSITPTLDTRPQYGQLLFTDDFSDPSAWTLGKLPAGSMALGKNELSLVISQERGSLYSLRLTSALSDFYLEITASPSICRGADEYGILFRTSPSLDFYRFSLSCAGQARLDRYYQGQASSPQPPFMSGAIPPGAPSMSRLGIWAVGKEMRFYANSEFIFTVHDPVLTSGSLGVFVRAAGEDMVSVSFSDLAVYQASK